MQGYRELTRETRLLLSRIRILHNNKYRKIPLKSKEIIEGVLKRGQYDAVEHTILMNLRKQYKEKLTEIYS